MPCTNLSSTYVRCNSKAAFNELLKSEVSYAGYDLRIICSNRTYRPRPRYSKTVDEFRLDDKISKLPNDEIELTFNLMDKDIEELEEGLKSALEVHNKTSPELRKTVDSIFSSIKKKVQNIKGFDFKMKIENAKTCLEDWYDQKQEKQDFKKFMTASKILYKILILE